MIYANSIRYFEKESYLSDQKSLPLKFTLMATNRDYKVLLLLRVATLKLRLSKILKSKPTHSICDEEIKTLKELNHDACVCVCVCLCVSDCKSITRLDQYQKVRTNKT